MLVGMVGVLLIGRRALLYFLPIWVGRNKRNLGAIAALDLLLGWTLEGWVVALVWALTNVAVAPPVTLNQVSASSVGPALLPADMVRTTSRIVPRIAIAPSQRRSAQPEFR